MLRIPPVITASFPRPACVGLLLCTALAVATPLRASTNGMPNDEILAEARAGIPHVRQRPAVIRVTDAAGQPVAGAHLRVDQISQRFLFGGLSNEFLHGKLTPAEQDRFRTLFTGLFNFTIAHVYWSYFEPKPGEPNYHDLDAFLDWARSAHLTVKGHPLAWTHTAGTPRWLATLPPAERAERLDQRIRDLVGRYRGRIDMWDVVNEPVNTVPWDIAMTDVGNTDDEIASGRRYDMKGINVPQIEPWVERAFRHAVAANPDGTLILNEFSMIAKPEVRARFIALVRALLDRGVPVRGLGIQTHEPRQMWFTPLQFKTTLDELATLGLPLHITEFIPQSSGKPVEGGPGGIWTAEAQADFAVQIYTQAFAHPAVVSINWWGFSDRDSWLQDGGLVDKDLRPKPVYERLHHLIREEWMTHDAELTTDANGEAHFSGFQGNYQIHLATAQHAEVVTERTLGPDPEATWTIRLN